MHDNPRATAYLSPHPLVCIPTETVGTKKQESFMNFDEYMSNTFPSLSLSPPLFYKWDYGIRFEIGDPDICLWKDSNKHLINHAYFVAALYRARVLFESIFEPDDNMLCVFQKYSKGRQKINKNSYCYHNINHYHKIESIKTKDTFYQEDIEYKSEHTHRLVFHTKRKNINHIYLLNKCIYTDFGGHTLETYFINTDKDIIYHLYDDRGLDIISKQKKTLKDIYKKFDNWILDYDREEIDKIFSSCATSPNIEQEISYW